MTNPLYDRLFGCHENSTATFLRLPDGSVITYAAFIEMAGRLAEVLVSQGLKPGDRLAVQVGKSPEALALYAAAVRAGVVFLPLNTAYTVQEMEYFITDSDARMVVTGAVTAEALQPITEKAGRVLMLLNTDGSGSLMDAAAAMTGASAPAPRQIDDLAALLYTSGTTGGLKGPC